MSPIISTDKEVKFNKFVFHYRLYPLLALLVLFFIVINIFVQLGQRGVFASNDYNLPYPGILPNHRLYPVKAFRDRLVEFFTRDLNKKAELYLLYADKRIYMAKMLADKKDWSLAEKTASRAEKYLLKVKSSVESTKEIGSSPDVVFLPKVKSAASKHKQLLKSFIKDSPREYRDGFKLSLQINSEFSSWVQSQK
jgi:hypothetical protein